MPTYPLTTLDESTSFTTVRFSDRSKFGAARIWLPDIAQFDPTATDGWSFVVRLHGGNGNNQGDIDPLDAQIPLMLLNELGCVIVSINWQDNGFYVPGGQDPRALFFPDGLLEPAMIIPWLVQRFENANLFGPGGFVTRDPNRIAILGFSDGAWRAAVLAYLRRGEFGLALAVQQLLGAPFVQPNVVICSQGHFDIEHFWMSQPVEADGWETLGLHSIGATALSIKSGTGTWHVGDEIVLDMPGQTTFEYLVTDLSGDSLILWPGLRVDVPPNTPLIVLDKGLSKYAQGGYSWLGAPMFRAGGTTTWANFPMKDKRRASLWPSIASDNARVRIVKPLMLYPASEPFVTNNTDPVSGWKAFLNSVGANPRYKSLHSEANAFVLGGRLNELGFTEGTDAADQFLMRAGGMRSNPDAATRFINTSGQVNAAVKLFLQNHGW